MSTMSMSGMNVKENEMTVYILTYYDIGDAPNVLVFSNKRNALRNMEFMTKMYDSVMFSKQIILADKDDVEE